MKIPRKLIIKGKEWAIKKVKEIKGKPDETVHGITHFPTRTIEVTKDSPEYDKEFIFWHEYKHARLYESGVGANTGGMSELAEEIICDDFADFMTNEIEWKWKRKKK